jgi:hypothetical protein
VIGGTDMPNWCSNSFNVTHEDPDMIVRFTEALRLERLFEEFVPLPDGKWDYQWCVDNWGTKWEAISADIEVGEDGLSCNGFFETAWSPPIVFFDKMTELGFDIDALYTEVGMCFAGHYDSEFGDEYIEYDFSKTDWRKGIVDKDLLELLESEYEQYLMFEEEFDQEQTKQ